MTGRFATLGVIIQIALRNLFASRLKTLILGGIIFGGSVLVVVGSSLLDSIERSMAGSIQGSMAGQVQVYSSKSKDELSLFGSMGAEPDLAAIDDFSRIKASVTKIANVKTVVPMGVSGALIQSGNTIDVALSDLRVRVNKKVAGDTSPQLLEQIDSLKQHVQQMARVLKADRENIKVLADSKAIDPEVTANVEQASSDAFWAAFDQDPLNSLEFLENKLAPQATDADMLFIRYVGTDMDEFSRSFNRMEMVDGQRIPDGQRGILFGKLFYEERVKLKTAHRLDQIRDALKDGRTLAKDDELKRWVKENTEQIREIVLQLDPIKTRQATAILQKALNSQKGDVSPLLAEFFAMDDSNFESRYNLFYKELAPLLELYRIRIGDTLTIKAFTRTGFMQAVNLKVYGTYQFKGLEKSPLSGGLCLMDLMSFRDLYGYLTADKAEEIKKLKQNAGVQQVDRANAEEALFGGDSARTVVAEAVPGVIDDLKNMDQSTRDLRREDLAARVYSKDEIEKGVVLNAAVILKDPQKIDETIQQIVEQAKKDGLDINAVSWQKASGLIGQFVTLLRLVLYVAVLIIFVVALVVMNNAMMMATLERVKEIGTMRAIGAQRRFILQMLLIETVVIGLVFGVAGSLAGLGVVQYLGIKGIPAFSPQLYFFFSGPRLYPTLGTNNLLAALIIVLLVSMLSSFYPAWLATRVSPLQAMQTEE